MEKNSVIKQMFNGERGSYDSIKLSKEYSKYAEISIKCYNGIVKKLQDNKELLDLFNKFVDANDEATTEECTDYYCEGFRFGILIGMDILKEDNN